VVLLAAGLDTRAFRLTWPDGVRLFELDLPDLVDYKERVLAEQAAVPRCQRTVLRVDLREDWPARLESAGLRPGEPTAWLIEGLLTRPACSPGSATCRHRAASCPASTGTAPSMRCCAGPAPRRS
jgi:hypothetical protein